MAEITVKNLNLGINGKTIFFSKILILSVSYPKEQCAVFISKL